VSEFIQVIDNRGRTLTPCRRKVAEREVRLNRAKWMGRDAIRLRFDPFAYRYIRLKVLARDSYVCYWCGQAGNTMDHVIPWSKGGRTTMTNCICACEECNGERGDMPPEEFARLRSVAPPKPEGELPLPVSRRTIPITRKRTVSLGVDRAHGQAVPQEQTMQESNPEIQPWPELRLAPAPMLYALTRLLDPDRPSLSPRSFY
jgi:hypothetical protein